MKHKLFILISLPIVLLASACGKSDDQPATTVAPVASTVSCPAGQVNYNNTCVTTTNGQPNYPGYNGQYYNYAPPSCGGYANNGYSYYNNCYNGYSYGYGYSRWYYYGGMIYYW
jgi:hypothetical protein